MNLSIYKIKMGLETLIALYNVKQYRFQKGVHYSYGNGCCLGKEELGKCCQLEVLFPVHELCQSTSIFLSSSSLSVNIINSWMTLTFFIQIYCDWDSC